MTVIQIKNATEFEVLLRSHDRVRKILQFLSISNIIPQVIVYFWAEWCGSCRMIGPTFEEHSKSTSSVCFASVDCDKVMEVSQRQGINAMPTFTFYKHGSESKRIVGTYNKRDLENLVFVAAES